MMPAPVRRHFGPLSGLDWPGPGRPLVVLHGVFDSAECWTGVVQQLAHQEPRCRVIGFDLDAHGQTPLPEGDFTVHAMVEHVIGALEAAGTEPVSLAGHSLGGLVTHEVALTRPDLVAALWLEDPAWAAAIEPSGATPRFVLERGRQLASWTADQILARGRADHPRWADDEFGPWLRAKQDVDLAFLTRRQDWGAHASPATCAELRMDTWLLTAEPSRGAVVGAAAAQEALSRLGARGTHRHFADVGHDIRKDDRGGYVAALRDFLVATA